MQDGTELSPDLRIENEVLFGRNGELFLAGGAHSILKFMRGAEISATGTRLLHDNLVRRRVLSAQYGARFLHLIAPEKYVVYPQNLPLVQAGFMAQAYLKAGHTDAIYPIETLRNPRRGRSYPLTDTHWTPHGILAIVEMLALRCGMPAETVEAIGQKVSDEIREDGTIFYGDLGRKIEPKQGEPLLRFGTEFHCRVHENGMGHDFTSPINDGRMVVIEAEQACSDQVLLLFGDSYLYHALELMALFFRRIVFTRTRFFHEELVQMVRPDVVISQMAERYMGSVTSDEVAPPFFMIPYLLNRPLTMTQEAALALTRVLCGPRKFDPAVFRLPAAGGSTATVPPAAQAPTAAPPPAAEPQQTPSEPPARESEPSDRAPATGQG